ncbi:PREDICTED: DJ-1 protein homolog E-like isoform X1 [Tarenaya hassleriana]|uniref:DJ-1 protein homolog E-like isoform X1 n=1 Tax=Tarenaya hassleriana TaxID=28532 RepID=UPI00053C5413|nr:PREDICTED: DJ-1 protein homolog E-like isoform X1 [Tarenaya hassleriana]
MGSMAQKSALILCGDYMEAYETLTPLYVLEAFGVRVHCVSPGRKAGQKCVMAAHDFLEFELYTELVVDHVTLNANFDDVIPENYDVIIVPGGRFTELLSTDEKCVGLVARFAELKKLVFTPCHSQLMLAAAGLLTGGMTCTAFESLKPVIELSSGEWWQQPGVKSVVEITDCVKDGNFVSTLGWPTHGKWLRVLFESLGAKICNSKHKNPSVLFLIGDYVEDHGINIPFRALQAVGCNVDVVTPNKKKGERCVTLVYDVEEGKQLPTEKRGHNFYLTATWDEIRVDDYDCVVVPGGRSPELLVQIGKAVDLVKDFVEKGKIVAGFGQGKWLLAPTGVLKGKRCASGYGMKVIVKVAGGEVVESEGCVADGQLVTAATLSDMSSFLSALSDALGISLVF